MQSPGSDKETGVPVLLCGAEIWTLTDNKGEMCLFWPLAAYALLEHNQKEDNRQTIGSIMHPDIIQRCRMSGYSIWKNVCRENAKML